jgi:hypothetical protein
MLHGWDEGSGCQGSVWIDLEIDVGGSGTTGFAGDLTGDLTGDLAGDGEAGGGEGEMTFGSDLRRIAFLAFWWSSCVGKDGSMLWLPMGFMMGFIICGLLVFNSEGGLALFFSSSYKVGRGFVALVPTERLMRLRLPSPSFLFFYKSIPAVFMYWKIFFGIESLRPSCIFLIIFNCF